MGLLSCVQDLNDLYYFVQVVDHGGFAPAGRALGIPKSKLSRRIALLEERLGVRLIVRSTRHFSVTEIGQTFYGHCRAMLVEAEAAEEAIEVTRAEPCGVVRVSCPVALLDARVAGMVAAFMVEYPRVAVHLEAIDRPVDILGEGIDLALRVRFPPLPDTELALRVLGESRQALVAAPALLEQFGTPEVPADLPALPTLDLGVPQNEHVWHLFGPEGAQARIHHRPRLITRGMAMLRTAALAGVGVVQLPLMVAREPLARGDLVCILPDWAPRSAIIHVVFASRRGLLPAVRTLIDFLAERFQEIDGVRDEGM
jgi:DNA-binding transcriptional LysR family regulator